MGGRGSAGMIRLYSEEPLAAGLDRYDPPAGALHHLDVRRTRSGDAVEVLDGRGRVGTGTIRGEGGGRWIAIDGVRRVPAPAPLTLLVGAGDRDRLLWLAEKAQETGATRLVPVVTERAATVGSRLRADHVAKLTRRAIEAMKQSGAAWLMAVEPPVPLGALAPDPAAARFLADQRGERMAGPLAGPVQVLVGPEGGLTEEERAGAIDRGFRLVRLAPATLRFETAALAALVLVNHLRREET